MKKKLTAILLVILMCATAVCARAATPPLDLDKQVSLTVKLVDPVYGKTLSGFTVYIWKVAEIADSGAESFTIDKLVPTPEFEEFWKDHGLIDSTDKWDSIAAAAVAKYVDTHGIPAGEAVKTNEDETDGTSSVTFNTFRDGSIMTPGLYLVRVPTQKLVEERDDGWKITYTYSFISGLVMLPGGYYEMSSEGFKWDEEHGMYIYEMVLLDEWDTWTYDENTMSPKVNVETHKVGPDPYETIPPPETETETTPPPPPDTEPETHPVETETEPETLPPPPPDTEPETLPPPPPDTEPETLPPPPETEPETVPVETVPETVPLEYPPEEVPEIPEEPWEPEVPEEPIPQTGMLWWPVPVMGVGGVACVCVGSIIGKKKDDKE